MSKVIAFSGGCFSGKTTTMNEVKAYLEDAGYKVVVLGELIRTTTNKPIDVIRKDPTAYLRLQENIIRSKIEQENKALEDYSNTVYLADRAITDSLFYLQNYVDKSSLSDEDMVAYCKLHKEVIMHIDILSKANNFIVIEFSPLIGKSDDIFRPKHIEYSKEYEHDAISILNNQFAAHRIIKFNLNKYTVSDIFSIFKIMLLHFPK